MIRSVDQQLKENMFVVPVRYFSDKQVTEITNTGQQLGVPFYLDERGAHKDKGLRAKILTATSYSSMRHDTLKIIFKNDSVYIGFRYSSTVACEVIVYIGARDASSSVEIEIAYPEKSIGPFLLEPGLDVYWSTEKVDQPCVPSDFPSFKSLADYPYDYDVIVQLSPKLASDTQGDPIASPAATSSSVSEETHTDTNKSTSNNIQSKSLPPSALSIITLGSPAKKSGNVPQVTEMVVNSPTKKLKPAYIVCETTYTRIELSRLQKTKSTVPTKLFLQRMQTSYGAVYVMQDLYGAKRKGPSSTGNGGDGSTVDDDSKLTEGISDVLFREIKTTTSANDISTSQTNIKNKPEIVDGSESNDIVEVSATTSTSDKKNDSETKEKDEEKKDGNENKEGNEDAPAEKTMELDETADECVICMTDPRSVAFYPCRHLCMCADCTANLPANQHKCPICRSHADILLQMNRKLPAGGETI